MERKNEKELLDYLHYEGLLDPVYVGNLGVSIEGQEILFVCIFEDWKTKEETLTLSTAHPGEKYAEFYQHSNFNDDTFEKACGELMDLI